MSKQYCKLIMVTPDNNNKYYEMTWDGGSSFTVKYGRVESTSTTVTYPYSKWQTKYNEKVKKGYKDVTDMVSVAVTEVKKATEKFVDIADKLVNEFMAKMKAYTDGLVSKTYSVKAEAVSQKQVDEAQKILDKLKTYKGTRGTYTAAETKAINKDLTDLYTIIPRKMSNVRDHLLPIINTQDILEDEQDNLDAMAAQVSMIKPKDKKAIAAEKKQAQTILDKIGISMKEISAPKEIDYLVKQKHGQKIKAIFEVNKPAEDTVFEDWVSKQKDKKTSILIHGTRSSSVIPILEIGLKIRPTGNFQFSGKAYGDGNYFSEHMQKSLGYTSWDVPDKVILVYEVHTGNPFVYDGWFKGNSFDLNYKELSSRGYDSTYVKPGSGLQNSEIIAYKEQQNRIKYIIWLQ